MKTFGYYAFDDSPGDSLNLCSRESFDAPITVNCAGVISLNKPFTTHNKKARLDYYIMYISVGELEFEIGGEKKTARPGDFVIFPPKYRYKYSNLTGNEISYYYVHFTGSYAEALLSVLSFSTLPGMYSAGYSEPAAQGFSRLFSAFSEESELTDVKAAAALQDILISLSDSYKSKDKTAALSRSVSHIKAFYTTQISVGELAALEGLSVSRYNTLFKKYTGTSPIKYITSLRIKHAATLLSSTNLDVKTVGELVGYEDNHFFSKTFKSNTGISPLEYRKQREK
jgi:AraC family transcriptional regulator of arabinose operon